MRKILLLAFIVSLAFGAAWLADHAGQFSIHWLGWQIEGSMALLLVVLVLASSLIWLVLHLLNGLINLPSELRREQRYARSEKGLDFLTQAMIASSENDNVKAHKHLQRAQALLPQSPLPRLMQLQLAGRSKDGALAQQQFAQLQHYDSTKALALRGMAEQARAGGNMQEALTQVETLLKTAPHLASTQRLAVDVLAHHGRWEEALKVLKKARSQRHITPEEYRRGAASLAYLQAQKMLADANREGAMQALRLACNEDPSLSPACLKYAELLRQLGKAPAANRVLRRSWKYAPHPLVAKAYREAFNGESPQKQMKKAQELAKLNPKAMESQILLAEQAMNAGEWEAARNFVKIALSQQTTRRLCQLMARISKEGFGEEEEERRWLDKAMTALPDAGWQCSQCGHKPKNWQAECEECHHFAGIQWQPQGFVNG